MPAASNLILPKKPRVRLYDSLGHPRPGQGRKTRLRLTPAPANSMAGVNNGGLTPEELAYALPGGLAKLAYRKWDYAPFIQQIEDKVLSIANGVPIYVMFSAPPRHGKTMFMSRVVPAWFLGRNPDKRVLLITYQQNYSRTQGRHARNIFSAFGEQVFGLKVSDNSSGSDLWEVAGHAGGMESVGAGGAITGKGADLLIVDDLVKGYEEAMSLPLLEKRWEWFTTDVYTRLEPGASVLIIMTRWTPYDVIGRIQQKQKEYAEDEDLIGEEDPFEGWETINYPAIAIEDHDRLGRMKGQALFPKRFNEKALAKKRAVSDDFWWQALYQGNPIPIKGNILDVDWFRRYKEQPPRDELDMCLFSIDTAMKDTELADYTVLGIWGLYMDRYHLLDVIRAKLGYPALLDLVKTSHSIWHPEHILIEDKGSGISLLQDLRFEGGYNVWPMDPGAEGKVLRMMAETATIRAGKVVLPESASWLEEYINEARSFPKGKKDQMDMTSQFLKFMRQTSSGIQMF